MKNKLLSIFLAVSLLGAFAPTAFAKKFGVLPPKNIEGLVRVRDIDPSIVVDLRYATDNNFTKKRVYSYPIAILHLETAQKLSKANEEFRKDGYRIKIWDAYRPPSVQKIFWELVPDERYVANPNKGGSRHNRGGAVDITLVDHNGKEIEMPTGFDDFSEKASPSSPFMSAQARVNIDYMQRIMAKHGFNAYDHEWWHFDDSNWKNYQLVDVPFQKFLGEGISWGYPALIPAELENLSEDIRQVVFVKKDPREDTKAYITRWQREQGDWLRATGRIPARVGEKGIAPKGTKKEGDGRTPSGIYELGPAFGYARSMETGLEYRQSTAIDFWVDDPRSKQYNQWIRGTPKAKSFERMKRDDDLYKYGVVIQYNADPVIPGKGSAIFLHIWRNIDSPTSGCVVVSEEDIIKILSWLDSSQNPVIIIQ